jgi:hypothetical protein
MCRLSWNLGASASCDSQGLYRDWRFFVKFAVKINGTEESWPNIFTEERRWSCAKLPSVQWIFWQPVETVTSSECEARMLAIRQPRSAWSCLVQVRNVKAFVRCTQGEYTVPCVLSFTIDFYALHLRTEWNEPTMRISCQPKISSEIISYNFLYSIQ